MDEKYNKVYWKFLMLNEWTYLTGNYEILTKEEVKLWRKYTNVVNKCLLKDCLEFCLEIKPFTYSLMFEGETEILKSMI